MAQPKEAPLTGTRQITINSSFNANPQDVSINNGDSLDFNSQATQACSLFFNPAGVFNNQTINPGNNNSAMAAQQNDIIVDYTVVKPDGTTTGPYCVQVGSGVLTMNVDSFGNCSIGNAAIPLNGQAVFNYTQSGPNPPASIVVNFGDSSVLLNQQGGPVLSQTLYPGNNTPLTGRGTPGTTTYTFSGTESAGVGTEVGTIKVGS